MNIYYFLFITGVQDKCELKENSHWKHIYYEDLNKNYLSVA
jgi:hypothetical protein